MVPGNLCNHPHTKFEHITGKENLLSDSLSGQRCLGLYENNDHGKLGCEYRTYIFILMKILHVVLKAIKMQTINLKMMILNTSR